VRGSDDGEDVIGASAERVEPSVRDTETDCVAAADAAAQSGDECTRILC